MDANGWKWWHTDGVGGSKNTPVDAETGKVNPSVLSDGDIHLWAGLLLEMEDKEGLVPTEWDEGLSQCAHKLVNTTQKKILDQIISLNQSPLLRQLV